MPTMVERPHLNLAGKALEEEVLSILGKYPSVIEKAHINEAGLVETKSGELRVPVYVASELGFHYPGRYFLDNVLYPKLEANGAYILDPFNACAEFLPANVFDSERTVAEIRLLWNQFNEIVGFVNYRVLLPRAKALIAIGEGGHLDDGVSAEIVHAAMQELPIPILVVRSDFRLSENITGLNPANTYFMDKRYNGLLINIPGATSQPYDQLCEIFGQFAQEKIGDFRSKHSQYRKTITP